MGSHLVAIPVRGPNTVFGSASQAVIITRTELWLRYTAEGDFDGRGEATEAIQLTTADSFTSTGTVQIFDADGNQLFTGCARATGTRFE